MGRGAGAGDGTWRATRQPGRRGFKPAAAVAACRCMPVPCGVDLGGCTKPAWASPASIVEPVPSSRRAPPHPPSVQVRTVQEAQQEFKKSARQVQRSRSAAALPGCADTELLRQQMEADRRERAAAEPAKASVAQPLPGQGARVATAKDAGINTDCC